MSALPQVRPEAGVPVLHLADVSQWSRPSSGARLRHIPGVRFHQRPRNRGRLPCCIYHR